MIMYPAWDLSVKRQSINPYYLQAFTSSELARIRLLDIVAADRESAPCGRWVRVACRLTKRWSENVWRVHTNPKLYCRWEQRR